MLDCELLEAGSSCSDTNERIVVHESIERSKSEGRKRV